MSRNVSGGVSAGMAGASFRWNGPRGKMGPRLRGDGGGWAALRLSPSPGSDPEIPDPVQNVHLTVFEELDLRAPEE